MSNIFISYRRKSSAFTLLLANKLSERLDAEIFIDFESIDQADFERSILSHLVESDVFLLMVTEHTFAERIYDDDDWVRKEIHTALERNIPVILVCENGLYPPADLPEDIRQIRAKQGIEFYPQYFDAAVTRLVKFLENAANIAPRNQPQQAQSIPLPTSEVRKIETEQSVVSEQNAQQILQDAITAYDKDDYAQALFLFEALKDIGYTSRMINIDETIAEVQKHHTTEEKKRRASIDYEEIAIFAKSQRTLPQALRAFEQWTKDYPEFVTALDTQGLTQKLADGKKAPAPKPATKKAPAPKPDTTPPDTTTPAPKPATKKASAPKPDTTPPDTPPPAPKPATKKAPATTKPKSQAPASGAISNELLNNLGWVKQLDGVKQTEAKTPAPKATPTPAKKDEKPKTNLTLLENIPITITLGVVIFGLEGLLFGGEATGFFADAQHFLYTNWLISGILLLVAFGWGMFWAAVFGGMLINPWKDIASTLVLISPSIAFVLPIYDGLAVVAFGLAIILSSIGIAFTDWI